MGRKRPKDEALELFCQVWDESTPAARSQFVQHHAPHLPAELIKDYSRCKAEYMPRGALLGLVHLFEGEMQAEHDESDQRKES